MHKVWRRLIPPTPPLFHLNLSSKTPPIKSVQAQPSESAANADPKDFPFDSIELSQVPRVPKLPPKVPRVPTTTGTQQNVPCRRPNTTITRLDPEDYKNAAIGVQKPSLLERRGEANLILQHLAPDGKRQTTELLFWIQQDIDWRPKALRRVWDSISLEDELKRQRYNPKRNSILGSDLSAAHFLLARGGLIKFQNHQNWVNSYRKDVITSGKVKKEELEELGDLTPMTFDNCTIPVTYDPNWRVECIDATGVAIHYEGFANFENLNHVSWLSLKQSPYVNDWCLDRVMNLFGHTLEYLDLSGCPGISERGLAAMWRFENLKTLVLSDLDHIQNKEIVCAHLEDLNPNLTCIGIDYENKIEELKVKNEEMKAEYYRKKELEERNTIDVESRGQGH